MWKRRREVYKPVIDAIKASIKAKQEELARLEGELSTDADEAQKRLEEDFHRIMEGELLYANLRHNGRDVGRPDPLPATSL